MVVASKRTGTVTKIWRKGSSGQTLLKEIEGLPYGQQALVQIPGLGKAALIGVQKSGSGREQTIVEVSYLLQ